MSDREKYYNSNYYNQLLPANYSTIISKLLQFKKILGVFTRSFCFYDDKKFHTGSLSENDQMT